MGPLQAGKRAFIHVTAVRKHHWQVKLKWHVNTDLERAEKVTPKYIGSLNTYMLEKWKAVVCIHIDWRAIFFKCNNKVCNWAMWPGMLSFCHDPLFYLSFY